MDRFIAGYEAEQDDDLMLCLDNGVAYQKDMSNLVAYDDMYYQKCRSYEDSEIANKINAGRIALVNGYVGALKRVVDIGIGSGEFIKKRPNTYGYDVNPVAIEWLKRNDLWADDLRKFSGYTCWDVIEHVPEPESYFSHIYLHCNLFVSIPIYEGLGAVRNSKHYRPNEHLYHFTKNGFLRWMDQHGFMCLDERTFEMDAGRDSIYSFAFRRYKWPRLK